MITIDPTIQAKHARGARRKQPVVKENIKGRLVKNITFKDTISKPAMAVSPLNTFLVLQEIGEYKDDQERLKEAGQQILNSLHEIRLALINNELAKAQIIKLKKVLAINNKHFKFLELQNVIDDIILRSEVELAKIKFATQ